MSKDLKTGAKSADAEVRTFPVSTLRASHPELQPGAYQAAAALHHWPVHAHVAGEPMGMSDDDFMAAIKAASLCPARPHRPALSPHAPKANRS